jgi:UDP-N-acetylmuramoyl-L-alanyl-D-glutamate--2,6-diaminopimelate ligase
MIIKKIIKKVVPKRLLNLVHLFYAWFGSVLYGNPSEKLLVIGVTGTSGKSSTIYLLRQLLETAGFKVGALSTIEFYVNGQSKMNDKKMTMLGKMAIQKYLHKMVKEGCDVAIVETTSEGAVQHRHKFINYDVIMLTNLYPEHIESHGSFENYKKAKLDIFEYVTKCKRKELKIKDSININKKICIVNNENKYKDEFLSFDCESKVTFGKGGQYIPMDISTDKYGLHFSIGGWHFDAKMYGEFNVMNITSIIVLARSLDIDWNTIKKAVNEFCGVPGRIEFIPEAEKFGFQVIVDYAFEPVAMAELYKVVELLKPRKIIHVFGSTGGGRDKERRFTVGKFVGQRADVCIITNEDPYDDSPIKIIDDVASAVKQTGKEEYKDFFKIENRVKAIKKAIELAQEDDLVLITGKGSEQAMVVKGKLIPWDDRKEVREILKYLS